MNATAPTPSFLEQLHEDEQASAMVEFVVLLPVYLLLIVALFFFGNLAEARQAMVQATQVHAWDPMQRYSGDQLRRGLFGFNQDNGTFAISDNGRPDCAIGTGGRIQDNDLIQTQGGSGNERRVAVDVLNNTHGSGLPFKLSTSRGSFTYTGISLFGAQPVQTTQCSVLLPARHTREVYQEGQTHPAVTFAGSGLDPSQSANQPIGPKYQGYFDGREGIWDVDARIRGSLQAEHSYFRGKPKVR